MSAAFRFGRAAQRADALASELAALAARLRSPRESERVKEALAAEVSRASWTIRGIREDKAVRLAFYFAVEDAIEHVEESRAVVIRARLDRGETLSEQEQQWRADLRTAAARKWLARPFGSQEIAADVLAGSGWVAHASMVEDARDLFAVDFPTHARLLTSGDYARAVEAMQRRTGAKWRVLAEIIATRLRIPTEAETLKRYVRHFRARFGR